MLVMKHHQDLAKRTLFDREKPRCLHIIIHQHGDKYNVNTFGTCWYINVSIDNLAMLYAIDSHIPVCQKLRSFSINREYKRRYYFPNELERFIYEQASEQTALCVERARLNVLMYEVNAYQQLNVDKNLWVKADIDLLITLEKIRRVYPESWDKKVCAQTVVGFADDEGKVFTGYHNTVEGLEKCLLQLAQYETPIEDVHFINLPEGAVKQI